MENHFNKEISKIVYANRHRLAEQLEMKWRARATWRSDHFNGSNALYSPLKCLPLNIIVTNEFHNLLLGLSTISVL